MKRKGIVYLLLLSVVIILLSGCNKKIEQNMTSADSTLAEEETLNSGYSCECMAIQ